MYMLAEEVYKWDERNMWGVQYLLHATTMQGFPFLETELTKLWYDLVQVSDIMQGYQ